MKQTRKVYNFLNTCYRCFNDIEYPLLGDFCYGEMLFQTTDGQDFFLANLIDNPTFEFIREFLKEHKVKKADPQKILAIVADKVNNKEFTIGMICPICKRRQAHFNDNTRTTLREIEFASWNNFQNLSNEDKLALLNEIINSKAKLIK